MLNQLLIGAGAMKAGTTWLYKQLKPHPNIRFTPEKEIHYFSYANGIGRKLEQSERQKKLAKAIARDLRPVVVRWYEKYAAPEKVDDAWYCSLFGKARQDAYCADFSNQYALLPESGLEHILKVSKQVKVIYTLREPLARLWSHVKFHYKFAGKEYLVDTLSTEQFTRLIDNPLFWQNGDYMTNYDKLVSVFGQEKVKLFYLEDFVAHPQDSLWNLEEFLGIGHLAFKADAAETKINKTKELAMPEEFLEIARHRLRPFYEDLEQRNLNHPAWKK